MNAEMSNPFFIAGAVMMAVGVVTFVLGRIERRALRAAASGALTMAYRQGLADARKKPAPPGEAKNPQHGGKEDGHD